jgi:hypothetical protein
MKNREKCMGKCMEKSEKIENSERSGKTFSKE